MCLGYLCMHVPRFQVDALGLARDFASGLAYLHEQKLMHRDINPNNFLVLSDTGRHTGYIIDFGFVAPAPGAEFGQAGLSQGYSGVAPIERCTCTLPYFTETFCTCP